MIKEKEIRFAMFTLLFITIALYEISGIVVDYFANLVSVEIQNLDMIKIGRFLASIFIIIISFQSKWVTILAGYDYIGGTYSGRNLEVDEKGNVMTEYEEKFIIHQSLLKTSINGTTVRKDREFYSIWRGDLIERKENSYTFILEIERHVGKYYGLLNLRIENTEVVGFIDFSSSGKARHKEKIIAKKSNRKITDLLP